MVKEHMKKDPLRPSIATRITEIRKEYCQKNKITSQGAFGQRIGFEGTVSSIQTRISDLENENTEIRPSEILLYAKACGRTPAYIITGKDDEAYIEFPSDRYTPNDILSMLFIIKSKTGMKLSCSQDGKYSLSGEVNEDLIKKMKGVYCSPHSSDEKEYKRIQRKISYFLFFYEWTKKWNAILNLKNSPDFDDDIFYHKWCKRVTSSNFFDKAFELIDDFCCDEVFGDVEEFSLKGLIKRCANKLGI